VLQSEPVRLSASTGGTSACWMVSTQALQSPGPLKVVKRGGVLVP
jgi:hypothetical protein